MPTEKKSDSRSFEDPLENYDSPEFSDSAEAALHDSSVNSVQTQPHLAVSSDTTVRATMKLMVGHEIACVLVEDRSQLVGIFGDRDVLDRVALESETVMDGPVSAVMTRRPVTVNQADSVAKVISIMAVSGYRHVPVIDGEGRPVGIVSPQRIGKFLHEHLRQSS